MITLMKHYVTNDMFPDGVPDLERFFSGIKTNENIKYELINHSSILPCSLRVGFKPKHNRNIEAKSLERK